MNSRRHVAVLAAMALVQTAFLTAGCMTGTPTAPQPEMVTTATSQTAPAPGPENVDIRTAPLPRGLVAYDFGNACAWPGFAGVPGSGSVKYSSGVAFGGGEQNDLPDPLCSDYVSAADMRIVVSGLAKGAYRGAVIAQNVVRGMVPGEDFRIKANGQTVVDVEITPEWFFSQNGFFYGLQFDDLPGSNWWDRYIGPVAPWREFVFESDGQLLLELEKCRLYALVLAPQADVTQEDFDRFISATQASREAYFLFNKFDFTEDKPRGRMRVTGQDRKRGYLVFSRNWGKEVNYNTLPATSEITTKIAAAGTPGERVPVTFGVRTLAKLSGIDVTASDLKGTGAAVIPSTAIDIDTVRYMLRKQGDKYVISPESIQSQNGRAIPPRTTKRWWLTVTVPEKASPGLYKGEISFKPANAEETKLELSVRVYPFQLAEAEASIGVWYDDPRTMGYCTGLLGGVTGRGVEGWDQDAPERPTETDRKAEAYRLAMLEADLKGLSEKGFNGVTVPVPKVVSVSPDAVVELDFSSLEPYRTFLKQYGINTEFAGQTHLLSVARQIVKVGAGGEPIEEFSEVHARAYKNAVAQIRDWWGEAGIAILAYAVDEPREKNVNPWNRNMEGTLYYLRLLAETGGMRRTVTTMRDVQNGVSYMPIFRAEEVVQPHPSSHNRRSVEYARTSGKPLRYFNGGGFRRLDFGWYIWSEKPEGYWQWHYCFRDFSWNPFWASDVGYVVYPSPDGPVSTPRYERAAQGILDYRYALTLEEYILKARGSGKAGAAKAADAAEDFLRRVKRRCPEWVLDKNWKAVDMRPELLELWRKQTAEHIMSIAATLK